MFEVDTSGDLYPRSLVIHQPRKGYRYSIDSFLLSSFVILKKREKVIDLGSGVGIIGLLLCARYPDCAVWGIEIQERLFRFAQENCRENELGDRIKNILGDFRRIEYFPETMSFDTAVSNPPYRPVGTGRLNLDDERTVARHETMAGLSDVVHAAGSALKPGGKLFLIYPAWRTADIMMSLRAGDFEAKRVRFIHARQGEGAQLVMVEARLRGGTQLTVLPPLYIWKGQGTYTDEVSSMVGPLRPNSY
ncbi:MAG: methyltransferase [Deltaproteobacteria bacterium]|nr:methyltransferase [Candidatus Zymogenaceae bacterium]